MTLSSGEYHKVQQNSPEQLYSLHKNQFESPSLPQHTMAISGSTAPPSSDIHTRHAGYDTERVQDIPGLLYNAQSSKSRSSSWDALSSPIKRVEHSYEQFDSRNASNAHLVYAEGDVPKNKFSRLYNYLLNVSIVTRWIIFIIPILSILWIPGILSLTTFPNANIWGVRLIWWSIWFTVCWGGWWGALGISLVLPSIMRATVGIVAVGAKRYIDWAQALHRYMALFVWTLIIWISWNPLIDNHPKNGAGAKSLAAISLIGKLLFGIYLCSAVLLFEKFSIQYIAGKFHERSYAERIADQKFGVRSLVILYRNSRDSLGRTDTLRDGPTAKGSAVTPNRLFKKFRQGVRYAATTTTTVFGNVASEIAGSSVLQPNSPQAMVKRALESANKSRLLARRLFYSFAQPGAEFLHPEDIARYFPTPDEADHVFALFDKDMNGDVTRDEVEMACLEFHREQLSIENSMRDLDSAVGRLDNILMSVYVIIAILIIAVTLETQLITLVTGAGTLILGLSWLIGGSLQEVLASIIFLFIKHPFDVGDPIIIAKESYTVKEIRLLSTVFIDANGTSVQAPNNVLNTMFVQNIRRSPQMSEPFTFDVSYSTTFEKLELLREKMLEFVKTERRDYQPVFDVTVNDFPSQEKMVLTADIKYKGSGRQGGLKARRRNKWICALKIALAEVEIYGSKGNPDEPSITRYTQVPWELIEAGDRKAAQTHAPLPDYPAPAGGWQLSDSNTAFRDADVFEESDELYMTSPRRGLSQGDSLRSRPTAPMSASTTHTAMPMHEPSGNRPDVIEMAHRT